MKFKLHVEDIDEAFTSDINKQVHYSKHVENKRDFTNLTPDEYEKLGTELALTPHDCTVLDPANRGRIVGYYSVDDKGRPAYNKYDKDNGILVVYRPRKNNNEEPEIITVFPKSLQEFTQTVWGNGQYSYKDDLPKGE